MTKRIIILITHLGTGGAQRAALRLARALEGRGHDVEVWGLYRRGEADTEGVRTRALLETSRPSALGYLQLAWRCVMALRKARPDATISFLPLAAVMGQPAALLAGVPARVVSHRVRCDTHHRLLQWLDRLLGTLGVYTSVIAVSEAVRQSIAGHGARYRRRVRVVHNAVDWTLSPLPTDAARMQFGLPPDARLLLAVGRMVPQKNYPVLLDAVAAVPWLHLVIAGDGPLQGELKARAEAGGMADRLHLLGQVAPDQMPHLYRACDAFALSSVFEGQSNALLEAMAEGMLIFASDIPEQVETLADETGAAAGVLLPADQPAAWTAAFEAVWNDTVRSDAYRQAARTRLGAFTLEAMADGFEAALERPSTR